MSNDTEDMLVWVGDLDGYINIDEISREYEDEQKQYLLDADLDTIGDITLFARKAITSRTLMSRGVDPDTWRWTLHGAETSLGNAETAAEVEAAFLKAIIASGRRYAIARYAHLENLSYSSAITATFPHGIRALLYKYMVGEPPLADHSQRKAIQGPFHRAVSASDLTAYDRAGLVRQCLYDLAIAATGPEGHLRLDRNGTREILSLCRLHFLALECHVQSISELQKLNHRYELARTATGQEFSEGQVLTGKYIRNWRMRHMHPLTFFFPYAIRYALSRAIRQATEAKMPSDRPTAVNELALARCGINLMHATAKQNRSDRKVIRS